MKAKLLNREELRKKLLLDIEKLKVPEGYLNAGYPNYRTLFGRDSLIAAWQMLKIDPQIAKATLQILAMYQGKTVNEKAEEEPGKILHEYRFKSKKQAELPNWKFPYFGSIDSTPLFIIVANQYFQETGDRDFLLKIWNNIVAAIDWILTYGGVDHDHFVKYERKNPHGLFHQGWRDCFFDHLKITPPVAIVEAQGYTYDAYRAASDLAVQLNRDRLLANSWLQKAEELRKAFYKSFWWKEESYYYLALDGSKRPRKSVSSNPGHLLFTGIIPKEVLQRFVKRLFRQDLFTPYGIRTVSENDPDFDPLSYHLGSIWPHDNWIIYYGLKQLGFLREANRIEQALCSAYQELRHMPELFGVKNGQVISLSIGAQHPRLSENIIRANPLQAWAACGLLNIIWEA